MTHGAWITKSERDRKVRGSFLSLRSNQGIEKNSVEGEKRKGKEKKGEKQKKEEKKEKKGRKKRKGRKTKERRKNKTCVGRRKEKSSYS